MIETPRLRLRNWREGDSESFHRLTNTPAVMRWLGGVKTEEALREVSDRLARWQEERGFTFWVVERKEDGAFLGFCGLKIADDPNGPLKGMMEVGWRFREDSWGRGYAKEAASASLDHAFDVLGADSVVAITFPQNEASWGLMHRLGMKRREDFDYDDLRFPELNPTIVYELRREEWRP